MSNISTPPFALTNEHYAHVDQRAAPLSNSHAPSTSTNSVNKFSVDSKPTPTENNMSVNKESLEKLVAMFEFAIKAMRSMLASLGMLPKLPGELDAQSPLTPGLDAKDVAHASTQPRVASQSDIEPNAVPGADAKVVSGAGAQPKVAPQADTKARVRPSQVTLAPEGALNALPTTTFHTDHTDVEPKNKWASDINVTVQVHNYQCPHTDENVALPRRPLPRLDTQSSPPQPAAPKLASQQPVPAVAPSTVEPMPELTSVATDGIGSDRHQPASAAVRSRL